MRLAFLVLVAVAPLGACSDTFVTAPSPVAAAPTILIRGAIMVDGVLIARSDINPTDIEEVEVIKGAAAAAVYATDRRCPPDHHSHEVGELRSARRSLIAHFKPVGRRE